MIAKDNHIRAQVRPKRSAMVAMFDDMSLRAAGNPGHIGPTIPTWFKKRWNRVVAMLTGTVKSYNPHKGWGFIECNGQDTFVNKKDLKGHCPSKGNQVKFQITQTEKGAQATNVEVLVSEEEQSYFGEIKSFNPSKGYGFIACEAFPDKDIFVLKSELPGGFGPQGGLCKFKVSQEDKGPSAKDVMLLGSAGNQVQQMKAMGYGYSWGKGDWGKGSGYGKGWDWGKGGFPGYGYDMWMPMQMPVWGKGLKGWPGLKVPQGSETSSAASSPKSHESRPMRARELLQMGRECSESERRDPEESRRRLQRVLLLASRNGAWQGALQNVFKTATCSCQEGSCSHSIEAMAIEEFPARGRINELRHRVRQSICDAWQTGRLQGALKEAVEESRAAQCLMPGQSPHLLAEAQKVIKTLQVDMADMSRQREELHGEVDRLKQQLREVLLENRQLTGRAK
eukprot:s2576_g5.t1